MLLQAAGLGQRERHAVAAGMNSYGARHSIPPNVRLGLGLSAGGLGLSRAPFAQVTQTAFHPAAAGLSPLVQVKHGISAEMQRLNEALADLATEVRNDEDDEPFLSEIELIKAQLQRLAEAL